MAPLTGILRESISRRGGERRLSGEKIKLSPLKVCWRFHETEAIINMQWHMHTSKMILDASSWIIKFPKVPFAHRILRAATTSLMNHSGSARIYGKRAGETEKRGKWLLCFIRLPRRNYISFEPFDSAAGRCGAPSTGDRRANEQIVGFAWLARRLNGSCKLLSVWGMVISSFDLLLAFKVELLSHALCTKRDCIQYIALDRYLTIIILIS